MGVLVILIAASVLGALVLSAARQHARSHDGLHGCRHRDRGLAHNRGPDVRRTASEAIWRAATAVATPQRRKVIGYAGNS